MQGVGISFVSGWLTFRRFLVKKLSIKFLGSVLKLGPSVGPMNIKKIPELMNKDKFAESGKTR